MRLTCFVILLLTVLAAAESPLTLQDCLSLADSGSLQLQIAREKAVKSRAEFAEANAAKFPTLEISGKVTGQQEQAIDTAPLLSGLPVAVPFPARFVIADAIQSQTTATLQVLLTTFGRVENQIVASFLRAEAQELGLVTEGRNVALEVKRGFFALLSAGEGAEAARLNLESAKEHYHQTELLLKSGLVAKFELTKARQQVTETSEALLEALKNEDLARAQLRFLVNSEGSLPSRIQVPPAVKFQPLELASLVRVAHARRPEIVVLDKNLEAADRLLEAAQAEGRPVLTLSFIYNRQTGSILSPAEVSQAILGFQVPLYDGGVRRAKVEQAESQIRELKLQAELLKQSVALEVEGAWLELSQSRASLDSALSSLATATEAHRMAAARYKHGISTSLEFEDAQRTLSTARIGAVTARYQQDLAFAELEFALGLDIPQRSLDQASLTPGEENQ